MNLSKTLIPELKKNKQTKHPFKEGASEISATVFFLMWKKICSHSELLFNACTLQTELT